MSTSPSTGDPSDATTPGVGAAPAAGVVTANAAVVGSVGARAAGGLGRVRAAVERLVFEPRLRAELGWLLGLRLFELALLLATLKILTQLMSQHEFGEFQLVQSGEMLVTYLLSTCMIEAYRRYYHTAEERGEQRASVRVLVRWYAAVTVGAVLVGAALTAPLAGPLGLGTWTLLAGALLYATNRWKLMFTEILDVQRERRIASFYYAGCSVLQLVLVFVFVRFISGSAASATLAYALACGVFAAVGIPWLLRGIAARGGGAETGLIRMLWQFGAPYAALMLLQWLQSSSDRFLLAYFLDKDAVAVYMVTFQFTGAPFGLMAGLLSNFVLPIAYRRARDVGDPRQLWAADKVLLGANLGYAVLSAATLLLLALVGPWLIARFSDESYALPAWIVVTIALSRLMQWWAILIQGVFAVHQQVLPSLRFRAVGALLTVPICWWSIKYHGIGGAAVGTAVAAAAYNLLLVLGPGGCFWLIRRNRARASAPATVERAT